MQQMMPPQGPLFPENRQEQPKPRFPSNAQASAAQNYEPQLRMQQSGSLPIYQSARYASGTLQPVRASQPVSTMQPMATMPTVQQYQAQLAAQQTQETPLMLHTVQGQPVIVSAEELRKAVAALGVQSEPQKQTKKQEKKLRQSKKQKSQQQKEQKQSRFVMKMSVTWFIFGLIGMGTAGVYVLRIVITFLLRLKGQL